MSLTTISISACPCSEGETAALALWSASFLPLCLSWASRHEIQPPAGTIHALREMRFSNPALSETLFEPLVNEPRDTEKSASVTTLTPDFQGLIARVAIGLERALNDYSEALENLEPQSGSQPFVTESRGLRRFQRMIRGLRSDAIHITGSSPLLVTAYSLQRRTLYIPVWLIDALPREMFEPNPSFYRVRPAPLAWLLLDALAVTAFNEFNGLDRYLSSL